MSHCIISIINKYKLRIDIDFPHSGKQMETKLNAWLIAIDSQFQTTMFDMFQLWRFPVCHQCSQSRCIFFGPTLWMYNIECRWIRFFYVSLLQHPGPLSLFNCTLLNLTQIWFVCFEFDNQKSFVQALAMFSSSVLPAQMHWREIYHMDTFKQLIKCVY